MGPPGRGSFFPPALPLPGRRDHGEGYRLRCPHCHETVSSLPGGLCPDCQGPLPVPTLPARLDTLPPRVQALAQGLRPTLRRLGEWWRRSPWLFLVFWGGLAVGYAPFSSSFVALCAWAFLVDRLFPARGPRHDPVRRLRLPASPGASLPEGATPRPQLTDLYSTRVGLRRSWWQVNRIRQRRGISVHLDLRVQGFQGLCLDLELRLLGPDERYLRGALPNYRGPDREALASHRTRPLKLDDSRFADLWIFMPLRALSLPQGLARLEASAEVRLGTRRETLLRHLLPVDLIPVPEDLWAPETSLAPGVAPGMLLGTLREEAASCGVCGDAVEDPVLRCPVCAAPHHPECFAYLDGCSRFGCAESPGRRQSPGAS